MRAACISLLGSLACGLLLQAPGCARPPRRFPPGPPLWQDPDRNHVPVKPERFYSGLYADAVDKVFFRPLARAFRLPEAREAINVNALDEVPDSAWFENRIGRYPMDPAAVARGACRAPPLDPERGPWRIRAAKTHGATPGLFIDAPDGHRYLLKFDTAHRPQRATAADVIGSKIYHAFGFHTPCNRIVEFRPAVLELAPDATRTDALGRQRPLTAAVVQRVLRAAYRYQDGRLRAVASRFLPGEPLGPYPLEGVRADDPNDVVAHQHRRELRGSRLLAAWLHHFDVREQNSLDMWVEQDGRTFVRHYQIDFGDSFGTPWDEDRLNRRVGHAYYFDIAEVLADLLTLGALDRPWFDNRINPRAAIFGYFSGRDFWPTEWKPVYPVPAFQRMTVRDALWAVRIIVRFSDRILAAVVRSGRLSNPRHEQVLLEALIERRDRIARAYLLDQVPLARFQLVHREPRWPQSQSLCFTDLAIRHAGQDPATVVYKVRFWAGAELQTRLGWLQFAPDPDHPDRSCLLLPLGDRRPAELAPPGAPAHHPLRYGVVEIRVHGRPAERPRIIRIHLIDHGRPAGFELVGLERLPAPAR